MTRQSLDVRRKSTPPSRRTTVQPQENMKAFISKKRPFPETNKSGANQEYKIQHGEENEDLRKNGPSSNSSTFEIIYIKDKRYIVLDIVGSGSSCKVYKVVTEDNDVLALKQVDLSSLAKSVADDYINEVHLLQKLHGSPGIIKLVDYELNQHQQRLNILLEYGETDLKSFLLEKQTSLDMNRIRLLWQQMLTSVNSIRELGIVHSDLKPANFLFVQGELKLIDFGIARAIAPESTSIIRDTQMGTWNYISPEALMETGDGKGGRGIRIGCSCDVWSLGCILYQMVYGKSPFQDIQMPQKLLSIANDEYKIDFPKIDNPWLLDVLKLCLQRNPKKRPTISSLLQHPFLQPQGEQAMQVFQAAALGNDNMQDVVRQILQTTEDPMWEEEGFVEAVCHELAKQCVESSRVSFLEALDRKLIPTDVIDVRSGRSTKQIITNHFIITSKCQ
ncbi:uncharacterized protein [Blastocystis hominis]|uniref:Protein kinase domain-containing protein n=1 Tax=Blastocystis hominis TaxID=12968 RepID=D8MB93_BLAHO|nr:uncharacterized protein [Blastocystis hominis]CBK25332.2 unnamed protein product [Blastocystis hominis]|eukprot:XP_012899380.1 uncharacterized protein [Blastocystis hominis]